MDWIALQRGMKGRMVANTLHPEQLYFRTFPVSLKLTVTILHSMLAIFKQKFKLLNSSHYCTEFLATKPWEKSISWV